MKNTLKNKGKKLKLTTLGFTLIELLGTIVILAIILLIAVPVVLNIIESVRVGAFKASATNIGRTAQLTYTSEMIKKQDSGRLEFYYEKEEGVIKEGSNKVGVFLNYAGEKPDRGIVKVNKQGKVDLVLYREKNKLCAIKKYEENQVKIEKNVSEKDCVEKISWPRIELIGENPLILEYERDGIYNLGEEDYIAYTSEGIETNNVKIYVDKVETREISRGIIKKEYEVIYRVIEGEMFNEVKRIIKIVDTQKPVIIHPGNTTLTISEVEGYDLMGGVSVEDNSEEEIEIMIEGSISKIAGSYTITYKAKDSSGNEAVEIRIIDVIDIGAPVITIIGDNPMNINVGTSFIDPGATAIDDADGNLTEQIIPSGDVNSNVPGVYYRNYYVEDSNGNQSNSTRIVNVIDNIAPTVTFGLNGNATYAKSHSTTVLVSDAHSSIKNTYYQWTTSTTTPTSGTFSQIFTNGASITSPSGVTGDYYLWIKGIDNANNEIITRSNVFKLDNTGPVVSSVVSGVSNITETSFNITRSGNASDAHSGLATNPYIYQISTNGSTWTTKCTTNDVNCVATGLTKGVTYYYRICTNDLLGNQSCINSKVISTTIDIPGAVVKNVQQGFTSHSTGTTTTINISSVNMSKTIVYATFYQPGTERARVYLSSPTTITIEGGRSTVAWQAIEFESGVNVQRGLGYTGTITINKINPNKSIIIGTAYQSGGQIHPAHASAAFRIISATSISITRHTGDQPGTLYSAWQVIEFEN